MPHLRHDLGMALINLGHQLVMLGGKVGGIRVEVNRSDRYD